MQLGPLQLNGGEKRLAKEKPITVTRIKRELRQAEKASGTGGTGATILRISTVPVARLIERKKIGPIERTAADEICLAFFALSGGLLIKPLSLEKRDRGQGPADWPHKTAEAVRRYQAFAGHWSRRAPLGDPTLAILIAAVVDEQPVYSIADDHGYGSKRVEHAIIRGLRDYAARSGWITGRVCQQWKAEAGMTFKTVHPDLGLALASARVIRSAAAENLKT